MEDNKRIYIEIGGRLCPDDCKFLYMNEKQQERMLKSTGRPIAHTSMKVGRMIYHGTFYSRLRQLEACQREILFRRFM